MKHYSLYEITRALEEDWSVRRLEEAAKAPRKKPAPAKKAPLPAEYGELCERLRRATGMKADLRGTAKKGRLILTYASEEELQRLLKLDIIVSSYQFGIHFDNNIRSYPHSVIIGQIVDIIVTCDYIIC